MVDSNRQAGAKEISALMISEGVRIYCEFCPDTGFGDSVDRQMVREIYVAMERAGSSEITHEILREQHDCDC